MRKLLMKPVPVESHYWWRLKDGEKREGVKKFEFDKVLIGKINKAAIVGQFEGKKWVKRIKITKSEDGKYVVWEYTKKNPVYVFEEGFYVMRTLHTMDKEITSSELNSVYRCASILNDCGWVNNFVLVI